MDDKRLEDLNAELVLLAETSNDEITALDRQIAALQQHRQERFLANLETINMQRGRIAEREWVLSQEHADSWENMPNARDTSQPGGTVLLHNAPHYHENSPVTRFGRNQGPIVEEREKEA